MGKTLREFGEIFNLSDSYLCLMEHGRRGIGLGFLVSVLRESGLSFEDFLLRGRKGVGDEGV